MTERLLVFMDDERLLADVSDDRDVLVIALDSQAAHAVTPRPGLRVRGLADYAEKPFVSYDDLYDHVKGAIRERFRPKDPLRQSRFLFEVFWDDILLNLLPVHYIETLVQAVVDRERPTRFAFAIADRELDALFRAIVGRRS